MAVDSHRTPIIRPLDGPCWGRQVLAVQATPPASLKPVFAMRIRPHRQRVRRLPGMRDASCCGERAMWLTLKSDRDPLEPRRTLRAVCTLFGWCLFASALELIIPQPSPLKAYRPVGGLHWTALGLLLIGAWQAGRFNPPHVLYLIYGAFGGLVLSLRIARGIPFWMTDAGFMFHVMKVFSIPVIVGLVCRLVGKRRVQIERDLRFRKGVCVRCAYDLTGNVSGVCPECGTAIRNPKTQNPKTQKSAMPLERS